MWRTPRLSIRPFLASEAASFLALTQDEGFRSHPITDYRQSGVQSAQAWLTNALQLNAETGLGKWAVCDSVGDALIGMGGLTPWTFEGEQMVDVTYRLRTSAWGRGLGSELAAGLLRGGFHERRLTEITATITPDNVASSKIAARLGMRYDRRITLLGVATELYRLSAADFRDPG
jgi:ribosomal-protein-alanine N-acetyltransferase